MTYIFTGVGVLNIDCNSDLEQMAEGGAATQIQRGKGDAAGCWENGTCSIARTDGGRQRRPTRPRQHAWTEAQGSGDQSGSESKASSEREWPQPGVGVRGWGAGRGDASL